MASESVTASGSATVSESATANAAARLRVVFRAWTQKQELPQLERQELWKMRRPAVLLSAPTVPSLGLSPVRPQSLRANSALTDCTHCQLLNRTDPRYLEARHLRSTQLFDGAIT